MKAICNKNNTSVSLLKNKQGFIFADTLLMMIAICSMLVTIFVIAHSVLNFFVDYVDTWMLQSETRRIFEDMVTEIEYANTVKYVEKSSTNKELIIETYRRSSAMPIEYLECLSFLRKEPIMYRNELYKINEDEYKTNSTQPLNSENYFGNNKMNFTVNKLADNLYELEFSGYSYKTDKTITLRTTVIKRSAGEFNSGR